MSEGDRDDVVDVRGAAGQNIDDTGDQLRGFAGAGGASTNRLSSSEVADAVARRLSSGWGCSAVSF